MLKSIDLLNYDYAAINIETLFEFQRKKELKMKRKCINTLVAVFTTMTLTSSSALPAFAEPNDVQNATSAVSESNNNLSIEKIVENIQSCDSKIFPIRKKK